MTPARTFVADAYEQDGLRTTARRIREGRTPSVSAGRLVRVVEVAFAARDIEIADLLDGYARLVRSQRRHECAGEIATAVEGLASSLRAGVLD